jgi:PPM family protein phosphatase
MGTYVRVAANSHAGRVRATNEDSFLVADLSMPMVSPQESRWAGRIDLGAGGALIAVADGMGGHDSGEIASAMSLVLLHRALLTRQREADATRLFDAVDDAHQGVRKEAAAKASNMGTTLTAIEVRGPRVYVAEVGDSRAYLLRDGVMTQLTKDQSFVQTLVDAGVLSSDDDSALPMRNVILQALGKTPNLRVELGRLDLRYRDCMLLCSDGLHGLLSTEEMRSVILASPDLQIAAQVLVEQACERGAPDNVTAVLVGFGGDLPPVRPGEAPKDTYAILQSFTQEPPAPDTTAP